MLATHQHQQPFSASPSFHQSHFPSYPPPQLFLPSVPLPPLPSSSFFIASWRQPTPSLKRRFEESEAEDDGAEQGRSPLKKLAVELVQPEREVRHSVYSAELRAEDEAVIPEVEMGSRQEEGAGGFEMGEMCW